MEEAIVRIPLDQIIPHPGNRRIGGFDKTKLEQLAESIRSVGVQQPAIVREVHPDLMGVVLPAGSVVPDPHNYQLVAGERRWRASQLAGVPDLPCVIRELDDVAMLKIQTIENLQREDVHPLDEADGYQRLIEVAGYAIEQVAAELGKSTSYVYQRLKLRDLIPKARELYVAEKITAGHAILIARLGEDQQKEVLERFDPKNRSVRDLADVIQHRIFFELSRAVWKRDDTDLVPEAGSCAACLKRTGAQLELFADVCSETKKDHCLDRKCFEKKIKAMVERHRQDLEGEKYLEVSDGGYYPDEKFPDSALRNHEWTECKKKDKGAQRVLIVHGDNKGRLTWGKKGSLHSGSSSRPQETKEQREKRLAQVKKEAFEAEKMKRVRRRFYEDAMKIVGSQSLATLHKNKLLPGILRFIAMSAMANHYGVGENLARVEGWIPDKERTAYFDEDRFIGPRLKKLEDEQDLFVFVLKWSLASYLSPHAELKVLKEFVESLGVDTKDIVSAVATELRKEEAAAQSAAGKE